MSISRVLYLFRVPNFPSTEIVIQKKIENEGVLYFLCSCSPYSEFLFLFRFNFLEIIREFVYSKVLYPVVNLTEARNFDHLNELDDFSLMLIFDKLGLTDLIKVAALSPRYHQLILDHYITSKFRLHEYQIEISVQGSVWMEHKIDPVIRTEIAHKYDDVLAAIKTVGHIFKYLGIEIFPTGFKHVEGIQSYVNKYCTNTVQKIQVYNSCINDRGYPLQKMSFPNATDVVIGDNDLFPIEPFRLDIAFPQMQKLEIVCKIDHYHYPHLKEVIIGVGASNLPDLFHLNPQVRRIEMVANNIATYLSNLSELPNLESLSIKFLSTDGNSISMPSIARFRHMKEFSLDVQSYDSSHDSGLPEPILSSIQFDRLQSFSVCTRYQHNLDYLIQMMAKNTELHRVTINFDFSFEHLSKLITELRRLKEVHVIWYTDFSGHTLNRFLEHVITSGHSLEQFSASVSEYTEMTEENLLEFIPRGWRCSKVDFNEFPKFFLINRVN